MTTAEALESMTDAGKFEILATRVLREIDSDCRAISHVGVNAQGKTIPNPIDGFGLVSGSDPPRYVMSAFTLTAPADLVGKWLFDHTSHVSTGKRKGPPPSAADDGDLIKAGRAAAGIRAQHASAKFVVWLCTNRRLDAEHQQPVYDKAVELGIEVRFLEQSKMRDFLDVKPEGQWLRQEHLGMEADQMSSSLLRKLSRDSHHKYANDLLLPPPEEIVPTRAARAAADTLEGSAAMCMLVGPSGAGKSVIANYLLRRYVEGGGIGLWIPSEVADRESSLSSAIEGVLRDLHPRIGLGAGHDSLKLGTSDKPLLLAVDDINRSSDPARLLRKLIGWSRLATVTGSGEVTKAPVRIVCPAWDAYWDPFSHTYESMSWIRVQDIGPMARPEAIGCLKAILGTRAGAHTDAELDVFAEHLHDDPILLGLFGKLLIADPTANPLLLAQNVIGRMTEQAIGELAAGIHSPRTLPWDYIRALHRLSIEIIRRRDLYPCWAAVEQWFQSEPTVQARLAELAAQGHVCRLVQVANYQRPEFRHDRILEYYLSLAAAELLLGEASDQEATLDPFFTAFTGRATARVEFTQAVLQQIRRHNPVVLVAAVPYLPPAPSMNAQRIVDLARCWLDEANGAHNSMWYAALWILVHTHSPRVLEVTSGLQGNATMWEARLRNGDASAGALALSHKFFPASRFPWLETLIEEAQTHHSSVLTTGVRALLKTVELPDTKRFGALCLAGYLGDPNLATDVKFAWEHAHDGREILLAALWAACRCAGSTPDLIGPMMEYTLFLQHDETGQRLDERDSLLHELRFSARHGFGESVLAYLAALGSDRAEFRWIVFVILENIDHPIAIQYVVPVLAEAKHRAENAGGFFFWADKWGDQWRRKTSEAEERLSSKSIAALQSLWTDSQGSDWLRSYAFSRWVRFVDDLAEISAVPPESPHYESAVWQRALRGDRTINGYVLGKVSANPHWLRVVPRVWAEEFDAVVDAVLAQIAADPDRKANSWSNHHFEVSDLLRDIPTDAAERLLEKYWTGIGQLPRFIQVALYHGTQVTRELAAAALAEVDASDDPFKHIASFFGFHTQVLVDRLTNRHLDSLLPYLQWLDDHTLGEICRYCHRFDYFTWATQHLQPEIRRRIPLAKPDQHGRPPNIVGVAYQWFPSDEELLPDFDRMEQIEPRYRPVHLSHWWDRFIERGDPEDRVSRLLFAWLVQSPSPARYVVAAELVRDRGSRRDFQSLLALKPAEDDTEVRRALADAEFSVKRRSLN